jgi:hypothetical protein
VKRNPDAYGAVMATVWSAAGLVLAGLGIVGEYVGKIYIESKQRPRWFVEEIIK